MENIDINKLIKKAKLTKPIPMAKPMDIAKKIKVISRLLPGKMCIRDRSYRAYEVRV